MPHQLCDGDAVRIRQFRIEQHDVRPQLADQAQRLLPGPRVSDIPEFGLATQGDAEQLGKRLVAIDDEHGDRRITHLPPP